MLKITTRSAAGALVFQLEGKLAGPWVQELERCWRSAPGTGQSCVDLSSVTFIDADGKALLAQMHREGAELVASGCLNKCIVEGIIHQRKRRRDDARRFPHSVLEDLKHGPYANLHAA